MPASTERRPNLRGWFGAELRIVAVFEFAKGALVLVAGLGLLAFVHRDIRDVVEELLEHLHLDPASRVPEIFVALAERVASMDLWLLAIGATVYAAVRIAEGYGLWLDREWAEWLQMPRQLKPVQRQSIMIPSPASKSARPA